MGFQPALRPFLISVAVLGDECGDAIRMPNGETEPDGCAIVEDVHREAMETDYFGKPIDDIRNILERVRKGVARRHVGLPKARQVGSDEAKSVRELRDEITEHVAGGRKAMQQQDRWRVLRPRFPIEDLDAVE